MRGECRTQISPVSQRIDAASLATTNEFTLVEDWNFVFRVGSQNYKRINFDWPLHIDPWRGQDYR